MNFPAAFELAMADVIRAYGSTVAGLSIRCWQTLSDNSKIAKEGQKDFPMADIRASAPMTDENQVTLHSDIQILLGTIADEDKDHTQIRQLYAGVQEAVDALYGQFIGGAGGDALTLFTGRVAAEINTAFRFGGFSFAEGLAPYEDGGANMIGITLRVHFSRAW